MSSRSRLILASAAAALLLPACGGETSSADSAPAAAPVSTAPVSLVAKEFTYEPGSLAIPSGTPVRLDNQGAIEHDFVVEDTDVLIHADAGTAAEGTVDLDAGDYTFYCSIPGHRASGMEGSLTIE